MKGGLSPYYAHIRTASILLPVMLLRLFTNAFTDVFP